MKQPERNVLFLVPGCQFTLHYNCMNTNIYKKLYVEIRTPSVSYNNKSGIHKQRANRLDLETAST